jgi:hypothetical protein
MNSPQHIRRAMKRPPCPYRDFRPTDVMLITDDAESDNVATPAR